MEYFKNFFEANPQADQRVADEAQNIPKSLEDRIEDFEKFRERIESDVFGIKRETYWKIRLGLALVLAMISLCFDQYLAHMMFGVQAIILVCTIVCFKNRFNINPKLFSFFERANGASFIALLILACIIYYMTLAKKECFWQFRFDETWNQSSDCVRHHIFYLILCFVVTVNIFDSETLSILVSFNQDCTKLQEDVLELRRTVVYRLL